MSIKKVTKHGKVSAHLLKFKTITSWQAIQLYGHTRIGQTILVLRKKGWDIATVEKTAHDRFSNVCNYAQYLLNATPKDEKSLQLLEELKDTMPSNKKLKDVGEYQQQELWQQ